MKEPTVDECTNHNRILEDDNSISYACWYPQMGGYGGKCIAEFDKHWQERKDGCAIGGCIELYVWHDGEFPFTDKDGNPAHLHICDPDQFVEFGKFLSKINSGNRQLVDDFM